MTELLTEVCFGRSEAQAQAQDYTVPPNFELLGNDRQSFVFKNVQRTMPQ